MKSEVIGKLGRRAFTQSLHPYKQKVADAVAIFGLDTEFVPKVDERSDLISWQLSYGDVTQLYTSRISIKNLYQKAKQMLDGKRAKTYVFVCFFSLAEIQFFNLNEWMISEFKGKYRLTQTYGDGRLLIVDLADWYPHEKLANVAELWGFEKKDYPIGEKVEAIARGEFSKEELLHDPEFIKYAKNDPLITQKIYCKMRQYFMEFGVDIVQTMTPANTSASMFRKTLDESIEQKDTNLRKMALECCWGGRMECVFRGKKDYAYEYDATGHHPNSAITLKFLPEEKDWRKTTNLSQWLGGISGVGKVYFKFPEEEKYPCLPVFHMDSLVFPLEGVSNCTVSEAKLAKECGAKMILFEGWYYLTGTDLLTKYLTQLQAIRNLSKNDAERKLLKLLSNSVIGKFFQKRIGINLARVQKYAHEHQIPYEEAIKLKGVDFGEGEATVGSCFYPEWYALILGYARATISRQVMKHQALVISSDSFVTSEKLADSFTQEGITYNLKSEGELIAYRTRFYRIGNKLAHHAVHNAKVAAEILEDFLTQPEYSYSYSRFLHLKESWRDKKVFGSRTFREMTVGLGFDHKRRLLSDGFTVPWKNVEEREECIESGIG